jgi:hypothetical protein
MATRRMLAPKLVEMLASATAAMRTTRAMVMILASEILELQLPSGPTTAMLLLLQLAAAGKPHTSQSHHYNHTTC